MDMEKQKKIIKTMYEFFSTGLKKIYIFFRVAGIQVEKENDVCHGYSRKHQNIRR